MATPQASGQPLGGGARGMPTDLELYLLELFQRRADPYGHAKQRDSPQAQSTQGMNVQDMQYLLWRSQMARSTSKTTRQITFDDDDMKSAQDVFAESAKAFQSSLSDEDKKQFALTRTPEEAVEALLAHVKASNAPHQSRLHDAISKISSFGDSLSPYFKIVAIFVSSHPEYAAIVWGGIRLAFQISSQYVEYFEKLADMLGQIADKLPKYSRQFDLITERGQIRREGAQAGSWKWSSFKWESYYVSLVKSLGYVYQDVLSFCHDARSILPRKGLGKRQRFKRFMTRGWVPVDQRFAKIIGRLNIHQQLFEEGLQEAYSTEMILAFNAMDRERKANMESHKKTQSKLHDIEVARLRHDDRLLFYYEENRARQEAEKQAEREDTERRAKSDKVRDVRAWIAPTDWTALFLAAEKHRTASTGDWILKDAKYSSWMSHNLKSGEGRVDFSERFLFISGKPGYGKTVLSTKVIADVKKRISHNADDIGDVAYFHFNAQMPDTTFAGNAFRAVLAQLLHSNREETEFIDLAALLMEDAGSGQNVATDQEIQSVLQVYLGLLGTTYLVFDGLDECDDWEDLVAVLQAITEDTSCRVVLLGRPHLSIASVTDASPFQIHLETKENLADMKRYLEPKIEALYRRGKLPKTYSIEQLVDKIATRADDMFLWVVLMVGYLSSPLLTPNHRLDAINNMHVLEGLDAMFAQILDDLKKRLPKSEWFKIQKMFQWLVVAQTPWTVEMLHTALACQTSRPMTTEDYIPDFQESLIQTCGSFVEVYGDGTVRFIHLSVLEFLANPDASFQESEISQSFHVRKELGHASMATLCLSYILYNIPHRPLAADGANLEKNYPLLRYAAKWWPTHGALSLQNKNSQPEGSSLEKYRTMFRVICDAIHKKALLSCWIETSWFIQNAPSVTFLSSSVGTFSRKCPDLCGPHVESSLKMLNKLTPELKRLNEDWGHILKKEPNEIWLPSINAVGKFELWESSNDAKLSFIGSKADEGSILIASQVSADGKSVGMLKIWTSKSSRASVDHHETQTNWEVAYQIWSLQTLTQTECIRFEIPEEQLLDLNVQDQQTTLPSDSSAITKFRFPVAFSSSLGLLVVHGILLKISPEKSQISELVGHQGHFQVLPPPGCEHTLDLDALTMARPMYAGRKRFSFSRGFKTVPTDHKCHTWAQYVLSPDEKYLIQINGTGPPAQAMTRRWIATAYEDVRGDDWVPNFKLVASVGIQFRRSNLKDNRVERFLNFHPFLPIVAICRLAVISLWKFMEKERDLTEIHSDLLDNLCWSTCGNYLQGNDTKTGKLVILNLTQEMPQKPQAPKSLEPPSNPPNPPPKMSVATVLTKDSPGDSTDVIMHDASATELTLVQTAGAPVFSASSSGVTLSSLQQNHTTDSSVVLQNVSPDGMVSKSNLMRLPKSSTLEKSYSTLVHTGDDDKLRLVLNMAAQETYSTEEKADFALPAVFDRTASSIQVVEEQGPGTQGLIFGTYESVDNDNEPKLIENTPMESAEFQQVEKVLVEEAGDEQTTPKEPVAEKAHGELTDIEMSI